MIELPPVLPVSPGSGITRAEELWACDRIKTPQIFLPAAAVVARSFQAQLRTRGADWFSRIEAGVLELIETHVANGLGAGVALALPGREPFAAFAHCR